VLNSRLTYGLPSETGGCPPSAVSLVAVLCDLILSSGSPMFVVIWQFEIAEENLAAFEASYGPIGPWAQLFRNSPHYLGTEFLRDAYIPGSYLTIDRWTSESDFRAFRKEHDAEYETLDRSSDALTSRETRIGAYTVDSTLETQP
jgi:heme-degrading monooxygenase HmoA